MNNELFKGNQHLHRITLFKEISYLKAFIKNYIALFYHLFRFPKKLLLYLAPPKISRYLGVYERCGYQYRKSTTMLRVEENEPKRCEGIAGNIRYWKMSIQQVDLPDIGDVDNNELLKAKRVSDLGRSVRKKVADYMNEGCIPHFKLLKKMHRKARHFYGTVIQRKNGIWGVLLADSISDTAPFDDVTKERFNSFARTISGIINMEV